MSSTGWRRVRDVRARSRVAARGVRCIELVFAILLRLKGRAVAYRVALPLCPLCFSTDFRFLLSRPRAPSRTRRHAAQALHRGHDRRRGGAQCHLTGAGHPACRGAGTATRPVSTETARVARAARCLRPVRGQLRPQLHARPGCARPDVHGPLQLPQLCRQARRPRQRARVSR